METKSSIVLLYLFVYNMKYLVNNKTKLKKQEHFYLIVKEIFIYFLIIFILISYYYICIRTYSFSNHNCELITVCTTNFVELEPVSQPKIWYKYILDDFFNKFTSNGKTINSKYMEPYNVVKTLLPLEHNLNIVENSVILKKIQSDSMKNIISECEFYKNKTSVLEIQLLNNEIAYHNLVRDIYDIVKEINYSPFVLDLKQHLST